MTEGRPEGSPGLEGRRETPSLTFCAARHGVSRRLAPRRGFSFVGFLIVMLLEIEAMSPACPERVEDVPARIAAVRRSHDQVPVAAVVGSADLEARIEIQLAQCRRRRSLLALLCISVEHLVSEGGGMTAALESQVRDEVACRIASRVRGSDRVLRESDRDTCVLLPGADGDTARRVAGRFSRTLNGDYRIADRVVQVTVRIGIAAHPEDGLKASALLRKAAERI
jgi:diguanylate cyclase (GGDEF)-like protein